MARDQGSVIFYLMVSLDGGGCQITDLGDHCRNGAGCTAGNHRIPHFFHMSSKYSAVKSAKKRRSNHAADRSLDGFFRA